MPRTSPSSPRVLWRHRRKGECCKHRRRRRRKSVLDAKQDVWLLKERCLGTGALK